MFSSRQLQFTGALLVAVIAVVVLVSLLTSHRVTRPLIDLARAEPVAVAKDGRPVVAVMSVEEYQRLKAMGKASADAGKGDGET